MIEDIKIKLLTYNISCKEIFVFWQQQIYSYPISFEQLGKAKEQMIWNPDSKFKITRMIYRVKACFFSPFSSPMV